MVVLRNCLATSHVEILCRNEMPNDSETLTCPVHANSDKLAYVTGGEILHFPGRFYR